MSGGDYRPDRRTARDALVELSAAAAVAPLPPSLRDPAGAPRTWGELLFDGERLREPHEPSQSLLAGLARAHATLYAHYDALPARARAWWLERRLGIARRPAQPDRLLLVVEGDPKRLPRTVPAGSLVKGKDAGGAQREYRTTEALRVIGASVAGLHSYAVLDDGRDVVGRDRDHAGELGGSFHPFGTDADAPAPHEMYVASELLRFDSGTLKVRLELVGVSFPGVASAPEGARLLGELRWEVSTPGGPAFAGKPTPVPAGAGKVVLEFTLTGGAAPQALAGEQRTWLRARFPAPEAGEGEITSELAFALRFSGARLTVEGLGVRPQAGVYNDGLLDLSKEFEPFGPVPRRGDAFYIRSDEALGKPLESLEVTIVPLGDADLAEASYRYLQKTQVRDVAEYIAQRLGRPRSAVTDAFVEDALARAESPKQVAWQGYRAATGWEAIGQPQGNFGSVVLAPAAATSPTDEAEIAGIRGRFVRALLSQGDFGWRDYQETIARNAARAARGTGATLEEAPPPEPPVLTSVTLGYRTATVDTTAAVPAVRLFARNGLGEPVEVGRGQPAAPFARDLGGHRGVMYLGLRDVPLGEVITVYVEIDEAAACSALGRQATFAWEYRAEPGQWSALRVLDGTRGLRHTGILRFVAPPNWASQAPEADAAGERWLRARTAAPGLSGTVKRLRLDAVEATYVLAGPDDPLPDRPLPPEGISGLRAAVVGVKRVTNPAPSRGGRARETEAGEPYFRRASDSVRHRNRAVTAWDVERLVLEGFPEVGKARCLPHHSPTSECAPGWFSVVVARRSDDRLPHPTVRLAGEIEEWLGARATPHARIAVLCPDLEEVAAVAAIRLRRGFPAGDAAEAIDRDLRRFLHPVLTSREGADWGVGLYRSSLVAFLEGLEQVEFVQSLAFGGEHAGRERIDTDACRGLIASAAEHKLTLEAAL